jgi:hypothetical protein
MRDGACQCPNTPRVQRNAASIRYRIDAILELCGQAEGQFLLIAVHARQRICLAAAVVFNREQELLRFVLKADRHVGSFGVNRGGELRQELD